MDMVNDGKDIRLDTPQAVKEALASGKDLYNPQTGEFWWEYNYTGSIANTYVHLDDPNLLAVIDNPDFDLYEDIVGGLNYTGYITDSIETIIEDGEENAPLIDPRDEVFERFFHESSWHHTSKFFNETDFYKLDEDAVCGSFRPMTRPRSQSAMRCADRPSRRRRPCARPCGLRRLSSWSVIAHIARSMASPPTRWPHSPMSTPSAAMSA